MPVIPPAPRTFNRRASSGVTLPHNFATILHFSPIAQLKQSTIAQLEYLSYNTTMPSIRISEDVYEALRSKLKSVPRAERTVNSVTALAEQVLANYAGVVVLPATRAGSSVGTERIPPKDEVAGSSLAPPVKPATALQQRVEDDGPVRKRLVTKTPISGAVPPIYCIETENRLRWEDSEGEHLTGPALTYIEQLLEKGKAHLEDAE